MMNSKKREPIIPATGLKREDPLRAMLSVPPKKEKKGGKQ
jgi:hypothetical protein